MYESCTLNMIYDILTGFHGVLVNLEWLSFRAVQSRTQYTCHIAFRFNNEFLLRSILYDLSKSEQVSLTFNRSQRVVQVIYVNRYVMCFDYKQPKPTDTLLNRALNETKLSLWKNQVFCNEKFRLKIVIFDLEQPINF